MAQETNCLPHMKENLNSDSQNPHYKSRHGAHRSKEPPKLTWSSEKSCQSNQANNKTKQNKTKQNKNNKNRSKEWWRRDTSWALWPPHVHMCPQADLNMLYTQTLPPTKSKHLSLIILKAEECKFKVHGDSTCDMFPFYRKLILISLYMIDIAGYLSSIYHKDITSTHEGSVFHHGLMMSSKPVF